VIEAFDGQAPQVHPEAFIHETAVLIGNVVVGARSSIWPTTVLRGDMKGKIVIGEDTSIQDGTVVHLSLDFSDTIVGNKVTVGHRVILHGCIVEDECLIGMGSIILDNAKIGRGSLVGAGALVTQGTVIPPGSLVLGSPAKVVRPLKDKERAMIDGGWRTYVEYSRMYLAK
jgi:carbonic anhydrase/acetyltransferase-like protein (isoleucine patch superfamily)